ncbi:asparagine synthase (glutamine-hydrolyzing) [Flagellimonas onchidii]|uniref:asparagine synthase (glutamine-hydrolyzing) n=1 Tax=Flagellimonas onchidii TaxID=2562684 RepID=UPI0010A6157B|nr:asparagine synthase (glutamine-hydrolyzing) [Allomuricauda onchidii]
MCGINGIIVKQNTSNEGISKTLNRMNDLIVHRGPDDDGTFAQAKDVYGVGMAMRRLSIIDLTSGQQPIYSDDKKIVITFNGEIYNYRELRAELEAQDISFKTTSDTEVILKLYEKEGPTSFSKLDGMFAFSIYDEQLNKVFIARDFFGEKPLYYTMLNNRFLWASELKSIVNELDQKPRISTRGLNLFLRLTYVPAPHTIYEGIHKLEANRFLEYDLSSHTFKIAPINDEPKPRPQNIPFEEAKRQVKDIVTKSVESRSVSDVPLGTFLSGGVDSSIVSLCLSQVSSKKVETFSIGFKKASFDETDKSQLVAKLINSNHHEFIIDEDDLKHNIHEILVNFDEPFSDTAALPTYLVSKKTREHVTVALTGDGGDEVFGGYNKYYVGKMNSRYTNIVPKVLHKTIRNLANSIFATKDDNRGRRFQIRKLLNSIDYDGQFFWNIVSLANTEKQLSEILLPEVMHSDLFDEYKQKLHLNKATSLTDFRQIDKIISLEGGMLPKVDRTSMLNSLECRAPFLNRELWELTNTLPEDYLMKGWNKKYILKEAFKDQFPDQFLEKSKSGFGSPVGDWLRSSLRKELESYIETKFLKSQKLFNIDTIVPLVKNHLSRKQDNTFRVWAFYCFQKWYTHNYLKI